MEFGYNFLLIFVSLAIASIASYWLLYLARFSKINWIRRSFFVVAPKSETNAQQLGGLPFSLLFSTVLLGIYYKFFDFLSLPLPADELLIIANWLAGSLGITIYGYIDDRFEIKPTIKLCFQLGIIFFFALTAANLVYPQNSIIPFLLIVFFSLPVINGTNLLDGLDTLAVKIATSTYVSFFLLGVIFNAISLMILSLSACALLVGFYLFNKSPAKIHLGEIGASYLGFTYVLLSTLALNSIIKSSNEIDIAKSFITLVPLLLPCVEIGISSLRRIYNRKSPFRGDRLHIHHLMVIKYNIAPEKAATIMGLAQLAMCTSAIFLSMEINPFIVWSAQLSLLITIYLLIGGKHWKTADAISFNALTLFKFLLRKDVKVLPSDAFDALQLDLVEEEEEEEAA